MGFCTFHTYCLLGGFLFLIIRNLLVATLSTQSRHLLCKGFSMERAKTHNTKRYFVGFSHNTQHRNGFSDKTPFLPSCSCNTLSHCWSFSYTVCLLRETRLEAIQSNCCESVRKSVAIAGDVFNVHPLPSMSKSISFFPGNIKSIFR